MDVTLLVSLPIQSNHASAQYVIFAESDMNCKAIPFRLHNLIKR